MEELGFKVRQLGAMNILRQVAKHLNNIPGF